MRILVRWLVVLLGVLAIANSHVYAEIGASANVSTTTTKQREDGTTTSKQSTLNQNYYLNLSQFITPAIAYQFYLRANLQNSSSTDAAGQETKTYQRTAEPALELYLRNPFYEVTGGYRRQEQWSTAHFRDDSRRTTEFMYGRFNFALPQYPSLTLEVDQQENYDYLDVRQVDTTTTRYAGSSFYRYAYKDLKLGYNVNYTRITNETPLSTINKSINDGFTGLVNADYMRPFWNDRVRLTTSYQGNYVRTKNQQFSTQTGNVSLIRQPAAGLYAKGSTTITNVNHAPTDPTNVNQLATENALINAFNQVDQIPFYTAPITPGGTRVNLGNFEATTDANKFHNIGVQLVSLDKAVDTIYIYVTTANLLSPADALADVAKWKVYTNSTNLTTSPWNNSGVTVTNVRLTTVNSLNRIFRYEITFTPQRALFLKVVNQDVASVNDVFVTEIEAYGTDVIPSTGRLQNVASTFSQGINIITDIRATDRLTFSLNYFVNRTDQNPGSLLSSVGNVFTDFFTKRTSGGTDQESSTVTRTYGAASTWLAHRLLAANVRVQRNESYDDKKTSDFSSNSYSVLLSSVPLPTVNTNLSLTRTDSYSFSEKQSTSTIALLNVGTRLYRDVNMTTDFGISQVKTYTTDTLSTTRTITGTLDSLLTPRLFGTFRYNISWTETGEQGTRQRDAATTLTYRPGKFINLTGGVQVTDADGNITTTERVLIDWLPLPTIRLNASYQHSNQESPKTTSDSVSSYMIWYITKFLDLQLSHSYTVTRADTKTESYNLGVNVNCRFW